MERWICDRASARHVRRPVPLCQVRAERRVTSGDVAESPRTLRVLISYLRTLRKRR